MHLIDYFHSNRYRKFLKINQCLLKLHEDFFIKEILQKRIGIFKFILNNFLIRYKSEIWQTCLLTISKHKYELVFQEI